MAVLRKSEGFSTVSAELPVGAVTCSTVFDVRDAVVVVGLEVVVRSAVFADVSGRVVIVAERYVCMAGACSDVETGGAVEALVALRDVVCTVREIWVAGSDSWVEIGLTRTASLVLGDGEGILAVSAQVVVG
jgi:hypothetical protein